MVAFTLTHNQQGSITIYYGGLHTHTQPARFYYNLLWWPSHSHTTSKVLLQSIMVAFTLTHNQQGSITIYYGGLHTHTQPARFYYNLLWWPSHSHTTSKVLLQSIMVAFTLTHNQQGSITIYYGGLHTHTQPARFDYKIWTIIVVTELKNSLIIIMITKSKKITTITGIQQMQPGITHGASCAQHNTNIKVKSRAFLMEAQHIICMNLLPCDETIMYLCLCLSMFEVIKMSD